MAIYSKQSTAAARARMAKRAKRARFIQKYKKAAVIGFLLFLGLVFAAIMTPYGSGYVYSGIQKDKMESASRVSEGIIRRLYNLGLFFDYSMRYDQALRVYDEIGTLYYAFPLSGYGLRPAENQLQRSKAMKDVNKSVIAGPPFQVYESDLPYVALAIYRVGQIQDMNGGRQFTYFLYKDLYQDEFMVKYPKACDPDVDKYIVDVVMKFEGRK